MFLITAILLWVIDWDAARKFSSIGRDLSKHTIVSHQILLMRFLFLTTSFSEVVCVKISSNKRRDARQTTGSSSTLPSKKSTQKNNNKKLDPRNLPPLSNDSTGTASTCLDQSENSAHANSSLLEMNSSVVQEEETPRELALKRLNPRTLADFQRTDSAFYDLHREVEILTHLPRQHAHIVRLEGVSHNFFRDPESAFFLQEKLDSTLRVAMEQWKKEIKQQQRLNDPWRIRNRVPAKLSRNYQAELIANVAVDLSSALEFLHSHRVLFRDIKPDNCGFLRGKVKLFDFGFARVVRPDQDRKLTKCLGTLRYLAPEMLWMPGCYSFPADVYSFGMLLWNLCTLEEPYKNVKNTAVLANMVKDWQNTPSLSRIASPTIQQLLKNCWQANQEKRPLFREIRTILIQDSSHLT